MKSPTSHHQVDFERQAHHFTAANVPQKRAAIDIADDQPKKRAAKKREQNNDDSEEQVVSDNDELSLFDLSIENDTVIENDIDDDGAPPPTKPPPTPHVVSAQVDGESQVASSPPSASPPLVDLMNIDDFFKMRLASFQDEMSAKDYRNFCLELVENCCDSITTTDFKLMSGFSKYDDDHCSFLKKVQKKSAAFKEVVRNHCPPLHAILTILESHLLCVFPLVLQGELRMHADKPTAYGIPGKVERWCIYFFDKIIKLQQQGNCDNYVVINCSDGDAVCMNSRGRGIDQYPGGVTVQHGCPKNLMEGVGSYASITIVVDVSFNDDEAAKNTVLKQLFSRFASAVPSYSDSNSIQSLKDVAAATTAVATRPSFLLDDIDLDGFVKNAIDAKASLLLSTCVTFKCNEKAVKGTRYCTTCVQGNKECCVEKCKNRRHSHERDCFYCLYHSDRKTRCAKCYIRVRPDGSSLCSDCNLLCRKSGCTNVLAQGDPARCSTCKLLCRTGSCKNQIADDHATLCSTCKLLCRTGSCKNQIADDHATLCSTCKLLCRTGSCKNQIADDHATLCSTCKLLCRTGSCKNQIADDHATLCSDCYKECNVIECKEPRSGASYCKKHSNPFTRCRNCKTRGLADDSRRTLCSTCIGALVCGHCKKSFSSTQKLRFHVDNNVCIRAREGTCLVERERIIIPNIENVIIIYKLVLSFL